MAYTFKQDQARPSYLDAVAEGRNDWWRWLLGFLAILAMWQIVGAGPFAVVMLVQSMDIGTGPVFKVAEYLALILSFVGLLGGLGVAVVGIQHRRYRTLWSFDGSFDLRAAGIGFVLWFGLGLLGAAGEFAIYPASFRLTFSPGPWALTFALSLLLLLQATAEELFFRGFMTQWLSLVTRRPWLLALISGAIFMLPHFANPEMQGGFLLGAAQYFVTGFALGYIAVKAGRLELAIGAHVANNIFAAAFIGYVPNPFPSLVPIVQTSLHPVYSLVTATLAWAAFYVITLGWPLARPAESYQAE